MFSDDDGMSWVDRTDNVSEQLELSGADAYPGSTPGPCQGIQVGERLVLCAWGSRGSGSSWVSSLGNFLYYSEDYGTTWKATPPFENHTFNECMLAPLPNGSIVMISRQAEAHAYVAVALPSA